MILKLYYLISNFKAIGKPPYKKGQRVSLVGHYVPTSGNPVKGSEYECEGTVARMVDVTSWDSPLGAFVYWDNGRINEYLVRHLRVCDFPFTPVEYDFNPGFSDNNPNYTWKRRKQEKELKEIKKTYDRRKMPYTTKVSWS